jgi:hypothetical protein
MRVLVRVAVAGKMLGTREKIRFSAFRRFLESPDIPRAEPLDDLGLFPESPGADDRVVRVVVHIHHG